MTEKLADTLIHALAGLLVVPCGREIIVFIISLLPILELRGGLIAASLLGLDPVRSYIVAVVGNILPIFFILWLFNGILDWMKRSPLGWIQKIAAWLDRKVKKNRGSIERMGFWGLVIFVGIPLPGTGAWTGCMVAAVLGIEKKKAALAATLGVFMASVIMMVLFFGIIGTLLQLPG